MGAALTGAAGGGDADTSGFFAALVETLPEAVLVAAADGHITFANKAAGALFGYAPERLIGESLLRLVPREPGRRVDVVQWLARWAAEPDLEQSRFLDLAARTADGRGLVVEVRVREAEVGGQPRYVLSVRDNTARRHEQTALKDANLRALRILLVAEDAVITIDADQKVIFFNPAAEAMFGYGVDEVVGQNLAMLLPPAQRAGHGELVEGFRASRQAARMMGQRRAVWGLRKNGEAFPLEAAISKVNVGGVLTYTAHLRDVTERNRQQAQLAETERRIRAVFDHASDALALLAPDGAVLESNQAAGNLTAGGAALVGLKLWEAPWLGFDPASDHGAVEALRGAVAQAAGGQAAVLEATLGPADSPIPVHVRFAPITDNAGATAYILVEGRRGA